MNSAINVSQAVATDACAREPIHLPGAIQSRGALLGLSPQLRLIHASANAALTLGRPHLGWDEPVEALFAPELARTLRTRLEELPPADGATTAFGTVTLATGGHELMAHRGPDGAYVLELERALPPPSEPTTSRIARMLREVQPAVARETDFSRLCALVVDEVQRITGFDRVMIYRFAPDDSGTVLVDRHPAGQSDYTGLRFPAGDIPPQARELYRRSTVRHVADVDAETIELLSAHGTPLDLTFAALRAFSPVHLQYLRNMGARSSMSISLLHEDRLWGLIACQHGTPHPITPDVRMLCEFVALTFGLSLPARAAADRIEARRRSAEALARILSRVSPGYPPSIPPEDLLELIPAAGVAVFAGDEIRTSHAVPSPDTLARVAAAVRSRGPRDVWATDSAARDLPELDTQDGAVCGILAVDLPGRGGDLALWLRPELVRTVDWAGDPEHTVIVDETGRLTPRSSFALWRETVRDHAEPWTEQELRSAAELRDGLVGLLAGQAESLQALNAELAQSNAELDAFAYTASHDLIEPLRGIHSYARFALEDHNEALGPAGREQLEAVVRLTLRMHVVIDALLRVSRLGRTEPDIVDVDLDALLAETVDLLGARIAERAVDVRVPEPLGTVRSDVTKLREVLINLVSNAVKYAAPAQPRWIELRCRRGGGRVCIDVADNGIGIAADRQATVFQLFHRLHGAGEYGGGVGAGLAIARRLTEQLGGELILTSAPGAGSTFTIDLPESP